MPKNGTRIMSAAFWNERYSVMLLRGKPRSSHTGVMNWPAQLFTMPVPTISITRQLPSM